MQLAQINIAQMKAPIDSEVMAEFVANLEPINALADKSPGFVWRMSGEEENEEAAAVFENDMLIINMSVWESLEALFAYTYQTDHAAIMRKRKQWFDKMEKMHMVLWYVPDDHQPTPAEALERLQYLWKNGPTPHAFTFRQKYQPEDVSIN